VRNASINTIAAISVTLAILAGIAALVGYVSTSSYHMVANIQEDALGQTAHLIAQAAENSIHDNIQVAQSLASQETILEAFTGGAAKGAEPFPFVCCRIPRHLVVFHFRRQGPDSGRPQRRAQGHDRRGPARPGLHQGHFGRQGSGLQHQRHAGHHRRRAHLRHRQGRARPGRQAARRRGRMPPVERIHGRNHRPGQIRGAWLRLYPGPLRPGHRPCRGQKTAAGGRLQGRFRPAGPGPGLGPPSATSGTARKNSWPCPGFPPRAGWYA